jgi:hypothetical protein
MVNDSRIALRVPSEMKEHWQAKAQASGLSLTAYIVSKVEGQRLPPELETEIRQRLDDVLAERIDSVLAERIDSVLASELQSLLGEKLAPLQEDAWPVPADLESLPIVVMPKDFDPSCVDADHHNLGTPCASCGGNGLQEARAL